MEKRLPWCPHQPGPVTTPMLSLVGRPSSGRPVDGVSVLVHKQRCAVAEKPWPPSGRDTAFPRPRCTLLRFAPRAAAPRFMRKDHWLYARPASGVRESETREAVPSLRRGFHTGLVGDAKRRLHSGAAHHT